MEEENKNLDKKNKVLNYENEIMKQELENKEKEKKREPSILSEEGTENYEQRISVLKNENEELNDKFTEIIKEIYRNIGTGVDSGQVVKQLSSVPKKKKKKDGCVFIWTIIH